MADIKIIEDNAFLASLLKREMLQCYDSMTRALVVDDNIYFLDPVVQMFDRLGFHIDKACDIIETIPRLSVTRYDLVITDS